MNESPSEPFERLGYRPILDGYRAIAVLAVMAFHAELPWVKGGFLGVDLFFVLSGFLITSILLQEYDRNGSIGLKNFYARRILRLAPALLTLLAVYCLLFLLFARHNPTLAIRPSLIALFYASNWVAAFRLADLHHLGHTWSLSVEEQFYLLWPPLLILILSSKLRRPSACWLVCGAAIASAALRWFLYRACGSTVGRLCFGLDTRADALLVGCLSGMLFSWGMIPKTRRAQAVIRAAGSISALFLLGLGRFAHSDDSFMLCGGYTLAALSAASVIITLLRASPEWLTRAMSWQVPVWTGQISYGLYLWHWPVFSLINITPIQETPLAVPAMLGLSFAAAVASFLVVERRFLEWKERLPGSGARDAPPRSVRPASPDFWPRRACSR